MSEPVAKQRQPLDFNEFERAIREGAQPRPALPGQEAAWRGQEEDPLAELARLVGAHHDPYGDVFAQGAAPQRQPDHQADPSFAAAQRRQPLDFSAIEAGLRGAIPAHQPAAPHVPHAAYAPDESAYYAQAEVGQPTGEAGWYNEAPAAPPRPAARSRRPVYAMAAVIAVGVVGIGVAFAYKGSASGPREIAMIKAAPGPTKIQPPADDSGNQAAQDASILNKGQQPAPTKLVSREEQPVDLAQAVQNAPRDAGPGITPLYSFGGGDASSVPVPAPPGQARAAARSGVAGDIEPIRVKTRSYRPDGTPIPDDQPPAAAIAPAPKPAATDKAAVAKASTPKAATAPKSTTRVASVAKPAAATPAAAAPDGDAPVDINAAAADTGARKAKPVRAPAPKPVQTAAVDSAEEPAVAPAGAGGFAVQLAAPGSEAEAKQASTRLSQKFAGELGGRRLSFRKAESNGKSVYRVRVSSLSREEATDLCDKLKSNGGTCFVAKN